MHDSETAVLMESFDKHIAEKKLGIKKSVGNAFMNIEALCFDIVSEINDQIESELIKKFPTDLEQAEAKFGGMYIEVLRPEFKVEVTKMMVFQGFKYRYQDEGHPNMFVEDNIRFREVYGYENY